MPNPKTLSIFNYIDSFPSLPATVSKVMAVTASPESSAEDLMEAILPDQSMCITLLKIANSAFFGLPRQVSSLEKAVMVLGFAEVRNIVLGKAVFNSFQGFNSSNKEAITLFWKHSFTCGLAAKIIAQKQGLSPSELFVAGLIHDIGKLAMLLTFPREYSDIIELSGPLQFRSYLEEQNKFSISHDDVGMRLLQRWLFPERLTMAIGYHHRPDEAPDHALFPIIIQMADILSLLLYNPDGVSSNEIIPVIEDFHPEIIAQWKRYSISWSQADIVTWFEELQESHIRDSAILDTLSA